MKKLSNYILLLLFGLGLLLTVIFFINQDGMLDTYLLYAYILFGIALVLAVVLPLVGMARDPKSLKRTLLALVMAAVLIGFSYLIASGNPVYVNLTEAPSEFTFRATDTGLILTYILLAVSFVAIVGGGIKNFIKNR
ncbi:MAG: hypothetical protein WC960_01300 [Bacteroidales bacterium]